MAGHSHSPCRQIYHQLFVGAHPDGRLTFANRLITTVTLMQRRKCPDKGARSLPDHLPRQGLCCDQRIEDMRAHLDRLEAVDEAVAEKLAALERTSHPKP